ncbi:MAG: hypothetical protein R2877_04400 [Bdellovibrionota bacterium]
MSIFDSPAITYYELYLRYLRWCHYRAASPFSHYSVGSSLGTTVQTYQKCEKYAQICHGGFSFSEQGAQGGKN